MSVPTAAVPIQEAILPRYVVLRMAPILSFVSRFSSWKRPSMSSPKFARTDAHTSCAIWSSGEPARLVPLERNEECEVCVVGAGIAGLTIAYFLAREGKSVIVLDKASAGQGETINTSAHLSNAIDAGYRDIERYHGEHGAKLAAESHTAAIAAIETIVRNESINCEFTRTDGYLFLDPSDSSKVLKDEFEAARRAGV